MGDTILVLFPLAFLWKIRLPRRERVLVLAVFSSSILTLLSALIFIILAFSGIDLGPQPNLVMTGLGHVEVRCISIRNPLSQLCITRQWRLCLYATSRWWLPACTDILGIGTMKNRWVWLSRRRTSRHVRRNLIKLLRCRLRRCWRELLRIGRRVYDLIGLRIEARIEGFVNDVRLAESYDIWL